MDPRWDIPVLLAHGTSRKSDGCRVWRKKTIGVKV